MSDEISFPPLDDLSAGELELRKHHMLSEITRDSDRKWLSRATHVVPRARLRVALPAVAAIAAATVAVVFVGFNGGVATKTTTGTHDRIPFSPLTVNVTRNGEAVTSIAVTVQSSIPDATMELQVLRSDAARLPDADNASNEVVYQQEIPMANVSSEAPNSPLSTWSGTLDPTDWQGGCQDALYRVKTIVVPSGTSYDDPIHNVSQVWWFSCNPTS